MNSLANELKFVYSLDTESINHIKNFNQEFTDLGILMTVSGLLKLHYFYPHIIEFHKNDLDYFLPYLRIENHYVKVGLLIETNKKQFDEVKLKNKLNKTKRNFDLYQLIDDLFTNEPSFWLYLSESKSRDLNYQKIITINPYYYNVLKIDDDLQVPYLSYFESFKPF
ncbi:hypothetical protein [Mycoplasma nasistruthionis]|uniref:Uncharacterized protein n=1 Tax=Mycoplasma nasistruthionis TaxID=353852 RepID=A0A4Y6I6Z2_9MOLU|nr:hypothetical protein [Mycoplasma nasistruthionis]QDF65151.1 hypothetical protein FIV53_02535 [Mycoplasma nasistruthionis]